MADRSADDPDGRRTLLAGAIAAHRRDGGGGEGSEERDGTGAESEALVVEGAGRTVTYRDRTLRLEVDPAERQRLEDLRADYHVFKVRQPETRQAPDGVVHLSAVTDAKHAADFVDAVFRRVYGADDEYEMRVG